MNSVSSPPVDRATLASGAGPYGAATRQGLRWGLLAGTALALLYAVTLSLLNGPTFALHTFLALWYWMVPLVMGFALQAGLFAYGRVLATQVHGPHASGMVASGGASAVSMVACCAHHLADVLPLLGVTGAAVLLTTYQDLFLLAGLLSNIVGIAFLLGELQTHGFYDPRGRLLAPLLRIPWRGAWPYVAGAAGLWLAIAIFQEVWL